MTVKSDSSSRSQAEPEIVCTPAVPQGDYTVAITSDKMGDGDPELGGILIKGICVCADTAGDTAVSYAAFIMAELDLPHRIHHVSKTLRPYRSREQRS